MTTPDRLAHFLFLRQAMSYGGTHSEITKIWEEETQVRTFWLEEAEAVLSFLEVLAG